MRCGWRRGMSSRPSWPAASRRRRSGWCRSAPIRPCSSPKARRWTSRPARSSASSSSAGRSGARELTCCSRAIAPPSAAPTTCAWSSRTWARTRSTRANAPAEAIARLQQQPSAPEVLYLTDDLSEQEMARLYRSCHCLVHPYRGEGFGLPVAEAAACGLPVIVELRRRDRRLRAAGMSGISWRRVARRSGWMHSTWTDGCSNRTCRPWPST